MTYVGYYYSNYQVLLFRVLYEHYWKCIKLWANERKYSTSYTGAKWNNVYVVIKLNNIPPGLGASSYCIMSKYLLFRMHRNAKLFMISLCLIFIYGLMQNGWSDEIRRYRWKNNVTTLCKVIQWSSHLACVLGVVYSIHFFNCQYRLGGYEKKDP